MSLNAKTLSRVPAAFATAMLLAFAAISSAHADEQVRSETVRFGDLNLGSSSGVEALYQRIHRAAQRVCFDDSEFVRSAWRVCARKAEAAAIEKVNLPQLTAYYQKKSGGQTQPLIATR